MKLSKWKHKKLIVSVTIKHVYKEQPEPRNLQKKCCLWARDLIMKIQIEIQCTSVFILKVSWLIPLVKQSLPTIMEHLWILYISFVLLFLIITIYEDNDYSSSQTYGIVNCIFRFTVLSVFLSKTSKRGEGVQYSALSPVNNLALSLNVLIFNQVCIIYHFAKKKCFNIKWNT
jgi:prolipoprotein diacylglyceryltransferase